jgi:hypothetical protein
MAISLYKDHLVVSSATFHAAERRWIQSVIISWKIGTQHHFHDIKSLPKFFDDKRQADSFGMEAAKAWIDKRL